MTLTETAVFCKLPYLDILGIMLPYIVDSALYVPVDPAGALGALPLLIKPEDLDDQRIQISLYALLAVDIGLMALSQYIPDKVSHNRMIFHRLERAPLACDTESILFGQIFGPELVTNESLQIDEKELPTA